MIPKMQILDNATVDEVIGEAKSLLGSWGVWIEHDQARNMVIGAGGILKHDRVLLSEDLIEHALATVPSAFSLWDQSGEHEFIVGGSHVHFTPGSAALELWDLSRMEPRDAVTADLIDLATLVESLPHFDFQSTSVISSDVPEALADRYRLYVILHYCAKPVVTGTFQEDAFVPMQAMLEAIRGGARALKEKPMAIFDCCPSAPLNWSRLTTDSLVRAARAGIPAELISMPLSGATGPVTLLGSITQHCAENIAGVVIHQLASSGAPIVYGGSPSIMDMRHGTTPMGAVETQMIDMANAQIGSALGLPTHAYMGLSDSPWPDYQAGSESTLGALLAALSSVNVVSGPGMLKFESRQSLEKLLLDHDAVGAVQRLMSGIAVRERPFASDLMEELVSTGHLLNSAHTRKWFREEFYFPSSAFERRTDPGGDSDTLGAHGRAQSKVKSILAAPRIPVIDSNLQQQLRDIMSSSFQEYGAELPPLD